MDRGTLRRLVRTHQAQLYRYMRYLGADSAGAEDLVQETFLTAFQHTRPPDLEDAAAMGAWLRGVARNLFLRHCRRARRRREWLGEEALRRAEHVWAGEFLRGGDGFDYVEALRRCLEELSEGQRTALQLRYARSRSRAQMARVLGMTENGVKSLLRRIRALLAACVRRRLAWEEA